MKLCSYIHFILDCTSLIVFISVGINMTAFSYTSNPLVSHQKEKKNDFFLWNRLCRCERDFYFRAVVSFSLYGKQHPLPQHVHTIILVATLYWICCIVDDYYIFCFMNRGSLLITA